MRIDASRLYKIEEINFYQRVCAQESRSSVFNDIVTHGKIYN